MCFTLVSMTLRNRFRAMTGMEHLFQNREATDATVRVKDDRHKDRKLDSLLGINIYKYIYIYIFACC